MSFGIFLQHLHHGSSSVRSVPQGCRLPAAAMLALSLTLLACTSSTLALERSGFATPPAGSYRLQRILGTPEGLVLDSDGSRQKLSRYTTGRITLFSFIYTYCTDAQGCPLAYATFHNLKKTIEGSPGMRDKVRFVSMSFDPQYDTPEAMRNYGGKDARDTMGVPWHFLTSRTRSDLLPLLEGFGQDVSVAAAQPDGQRIPMLSHMLKVFLIDAHGQVREIYSPAFLRQEMMFNDIQTLLMEQNIKR
ncbi:cytochrome c peroxidase/protein SCO1/2 [Collimonas sp. PA-H2]|uniref:SCO family protein n=1 Tax=Collimonas sp. PA-H2 TaxID=1881062 RepID=UPI000BF32329|nr:SCO family protein [Collimonas sp. PA-H2]PFH07985.1 cytochrome c peroxidase/protein SCO1/2 [Collimonas sp. PA-H2]